jgi:hypothetical protein
MDNHSYDPNNQVFIDLEKEIRRYSPDLILVEGGNIQKSSTKEEAIVKGGESRFSAFIGYELGIPVCDLEPPIVEDIKNNLSIYEIDQVLAMYLIRLIYNDQKRYKEGMIDIGDFYKKYVGYLRNLVEISELKVYINEEYIKNLLNKYVNENFDIEKWTVYNYYDLLYKKNNVINSIIWESNSFRNKYFIKVIVENAKLYNRVFVMLGSGHMQDIRKDIEIIYK